ncbi:transcriptional regulator, TetR family [Lachnospiraceae bacterium KM106-2]|nr:transcriptional regulator, TetR family [Lachnospiraceae bacterium KM106-2]
MNHSPKYIHRKEELYKQMKAIIMRDGYEHITVRGICKEINISTGTFYHYFPNKGDLASVLFQSMDSYLTEHANTYFTEDAHRNLLLFCTWYASYTVHQGIEACRLISSEPLCSDEFNHLDEERPIFQLLHQCITDGQNRNQLISTISPDSLTRMILISIRGYSSDWAKHHGNYDLEKELLNFMTLLSRSFVV